MQLQKEIARKIFNLILFFFSLFIIFVALYFYISAETRFDAISTSIDAVREALAGENLITSLRNNVSGFFGLFISQLIVFLVAAGSLIFGLWFVTQLYFTEKKNALIDPLMKIYNRRAILYILDKELKRAIKFKHPISVAMVDVDYFKRYNDTLGHVAGDRLLRRIAGLLKKSVRDIDFVGRYGGEEFLVVFPETKLDDAAKVCERLRNAVEKARFYGESKLEHGNVTISVGLTDLGGGERLKREIFVDRADDHLYEAKELGRNVVVSDK